MKTTQEKIAVMTAFVEGKKIEITANGGKWLDLGWEPVWDWDNCNYRIKQEETESLRTPMTIPWDVIRPEFKYAAMDEGGEVYVYAQEPEWIYAAGHGRDYWTSGDNDNYACLDMLIIDKGTVSWKDSLVKRPE